MLPANDKILTNIRRLFLERNVLAEKISAIDRELRHMLDISDQIRTGRNGKGCQTKTLPRYAKVKFMSVYQHVRRSSGKVHAREICRGTEPPRFGAYGEGFCVRGTGNNTINKYQALIRAILAWGADQELIARNP